jgi:hypothetical protein
VISSTLLTLLVLPVLYDLFATLLAGPAAPERAEDNGQTVSAHPQGMVSADGAAVPARVSATPSAPARI